MAPRAIRKMDIPIPMPGDRSRGPRRRRADLVDLAGGRVPQPLAVGAVLVNDSRPADRVPPGSSPRMRRRKTTALLCALAAALAAAPAAEASSRQLTVMQDDGLL